ncbi:hypothetical protein OB236_14850 [Paenibacillus sp. WQ 127069]|uniref:Uncharacterized protein n=1 Tax=Paenibacillus baimaensis TaxID=2982185 RepID=A0ABT2UFG3_9BACL|nr:hypothetical protein [Paenibacillus sp. WQ 127069]MCU6793383.1 hypothetical protein [Paenibacillus sp. WQ 127069]
MLETAWDLEIKMIVPFHSIIFYPDDYKDEYIEEPTFKKLREFLNIEINVSEIVEDLRKNRPRNSTISVYYSESSFNQFILFDSDMDPTDQLDLITVCIRCTAEYGGTIRLYAHEFYTNCCEYNVIYSEGSYVIRDLYKINFSQNSKINKDECKEKLIKKNLKFFKSGELISTINL